MPGNKLITLLRALNARERRRFLDFLHSPYFNTRSELIPFAEALFAALEKDETGPIDVKAAHEAASPEAPFQEKQAAYWMNYLLRLAEDFLATERFQNDSYERRHHLLEELVDRNLLVHYQFHLRRFTADLDRRPVHDAHWFYWSWQLADLENRHFHQKDERRSDPKLQKTADALDQFYLLKKLALLSEMRNRERLFSQTHEPYFADEAQQMADAEHLAGVPIIRIYALVLKMLSAKDSKDHFEACSQLFAVHHHLLARPERVTILSHLLNFCIGRIRMETDKNYFMEEALRLYLFGIEEEILLKDGVLSPWHFKNVVKLAINLKQLNWAKTFVQRYSERLSAEVRENAIFFNLADIHFHLREFDDALQCLSKVTYSDIHYQLNTRTLLIKIFFEKREEEILLANLAAFTLFLKRNKSLSGDLRRTYLNFCKLLNRILRNGNQDQARLARAIRQTSPLTDRDWLLGASAVGF